KQILSSNDIPVPYGDIAYTFQAALMSASHIGYPVVVKPFDANQGKGVTLSIKEGYELECAFNEAVKFSKGVIVEKFVVGKDYRILVVGDRVAAVSERIPPFVTGDGVHTVNELVLAENGNPLRGDDHEKQLTKIKIDGTALQVLHRNGLSIDSVPLPEKKVFLRENGNLSTGGTARDCTDDIHPVNSAMAVKAARLLGLDVAGIDVTTCDISIPIRRGEGAVIEVNAAPGLRMHLYPTEGRARNVTKDIIDMIYPEGEPYTIPIISITGTNGKTTVTRLISHVLALTGMTVGMTTTSGIFIGNQCISKGDNTGPVSAGIVLSDKRVEAAVLETARGGIVRKGLGYDLADVGVVVNISEDHLGVDGINTLEDLAFAKALVVEAVKKDGYAVLNADDEMTPFLLQRVNSRVILFTRQTDNLLIFKHVESGEKAVYVKDGSVYADAAEAENFIIKLEDVPITFSGKAECNVENSLAAISALYALDIPSALIREGLKTFKPDILTNPGRFNIINMGDFQVMLDYGHNPAGYSAVTACMANIKAGRYVGVIGMPGDRSNKNIKEVGVICGHTFAQLYIKEDVDLRGRKPGEVAGLLYDAALSTGMDKDFVEVIHSELKALETAIINAQQDDLIVVFYEDFESMLKLVESMKDEKTARTPDKAVAAG
ncbi:MAG: cyanophycin synthetase, partial [Ruminiclostridium sp.]|nr:cyanophycin synthetase [Ruminiclostridium sp.]